LGKDVALSCPLLQLHTVAEHLAGCRRISLNIVSNLTQELEAIEE
jgi:hypothetical protein